MAASTDAMYNAASRYLHQKLVIHFSGEDPLEVTESNYLIMSNVLEESYKTSPSPFGDVTSNEISFSLYNDDGRFNPENVKGPYYGKIRRGVKIEVFIRPDEVDEWDPLGVFYVSEWGTTSSGITAEIIAHDALYTVLNSPVPTSKVLQEVPLADFIEEFFNFFNLSVKIDPTIDLVLPYGFTTGYSDNRQLLMDLMIAANADCFCQHDGSVYVRSKTASRPVRASFTDNDQIMSIEIKHTLATDYDSAAVTCNVMQESADQTLLRIEDFEVRPGLNTTEKMKFSQQPVVRVKALRVESEIPVKPVSFIASSVDVVGTLQSTAGGTAKVEVIGTILDTVASVIATHGTSAIEIDSKFVQTVRNASELSNFVDAFVRDELPTLNMIIRGNPNLQLGDKIQVQSSKYMLTYTGILTKASYNYVGSLSCEITLTADMTREG